MRSIYCFSGQQCGRKPALKPDAAASISAHGRTKITMCRHQSTLIFNEYFPAARDLGLPLEAATVAVVPSGTSIVSEAVCALADFLLIETRIIP